MSTRSQAVEITHRLYEVDEGYTEEERRQKEEEWYQNTRRHRKRRTLDSSTPNYDPRFEYSEFTYMIQDWSGDVQDVLEKELREGYTYVRRVREEAKNDGQYVAMLNDQTNYQKVIDGLLYTILTETDINQRRQHLQVLDIVNTDKFQYTIHRLSLLAADADLLTYTPFRKLKFESRMRMMQIIEKIAQTNFERLQPLLVLLTRHIKSGDVSKQNIALARSVIGILNKNWRRLDSRTDIIPITVYSFARLMADHALELDLQKAEVEYVCTMMRNRFSDCLRIGRDLVRVLLAANSIPAINKLWKDLLDVPENFDPPVALRQILATPTPPYIIAQRVTAEMDVKMRFILDQVESLYSKASIRAYRTSHLSDCSESIYVDLIRFICVAVQPPNTIIGSSIVQRWEAIIRLASRMRDPEAIQEVKLAIFWDWLFWNPGVDNIMYIEPAMLLLEKPIQSSRPDTSIISSHIEYLYYAVDKLYPAMAGEIRVCANFAMYSLVQMGVIRSLRRIFLADHLPKETRGQMENLFPHFVRANDGRLPPVSAVMEGAKEASRQSQKGRQQETQTPAFLAKVQEKNFLELVKEIKQMTQPDGLPLLYAKLFEIFILPSLRSPDVLDAMYSLTIAPQQRNDIFLECSYRTYIHNEGAREKLVGVMRRARKAEKKFGGMVLEFVLRKVGSEEGVKGFYRNVVGEGERFGEILVGDLETIHEQESETFYNSILPAACIHFSDECVGNGRFLDLVISLMHFELCDTISSSLENGEYGLFGRKVDVRVLYTFTKTHDAVSTMFLYKLLQSEKAGRIQEIEELVQSVVLAPSGEEKEVVKYLAPLLKTIPPTPILLLILLTDASCTSFNQSVIRHWSNCCDRNMIIECLLGALGTVMDLVSGGKGGEVGVMVGRLVEGLRGWGGVLLEDERVKGVLERVLVGFGGGV